GSHKAEECSQNSPAEQVCFSGGDIYEDPSLLRFYQNEDIPPCGNSKHKEKGEDGPEWIIRSKFEDELANFMLKKKFHMKGIGEMLDQHPPSQSTPTDLAEGATKKEGPKGAESSIMQDEEAPRSSILYQPSRSSNLPFLS
ncbi:hypothetical protein Tco_0466606, partial [Tanacetum coccineum]